MNCPNKSLKDWNDLVDKVGVQQAYSIFIKNGNVVPYLQNRESNRFIWDIENKKWAGDKALVTWVKEGNTNVKKRNGFDRDTASRIVDKIKAEYIGDYNVFLTTPDTKGEFGVKLTGMPLLRSLFEVSADDVQDAREAYENFKLYEEFKFREEEANENIIPVDEDIRLFDEEQRYYNDVVLDKGIFAKQKEILSAIMPQVEEIVEDRSLVVSGKLEAGGKRIIINPDLLTRDTLGHEYGHLLIDLRGGMNDPFIQQGRKQLIGSKVERRVLDLYPDLYGTERFDKEVLAQAIGEEVADLFDSMDKRNNFAEWLLRFFRWLGTRTGITRNNAKELAKQLVGQTELDTTKFIGVSSEYEQEQRSDNDVTDQDIEDAAERIKTHEVKLDTKTRLEQLRERAVEITATRLRTISHKGNSADVKRLDEVLTELTNDKVSNALALRNFVINTTNHINRSYTTYLSLKDKEAKGKKDAFNVRMLERWYDVFTGYDILEDVASYMTSEYNILDSSTTKKYLNMLNDAINKKNTIRDLYKTKGVELLSDELSKYSTQLIIDEREAKHKEWLNKSIAERGGKSMEQYADDYLKENMSDIVNRSKSTLIKEMQLASSDINYLQRWLDTILDSNDMVLSATVKKIVIADRKARAKSIEFKEDLLQKLKALESQIGYSHYSGKISNLYDFMLEKDDTGKKYTGHILTKFSSKLMNEYRKVLDATSELPLNERWAERNKWKEANMPLDRSARDNELSEYMKSLISDGILSKEEFSIYFETAQMPYSSRPLLINIMNTEAARAIEDWLVTNSMSFRNPIKKWENTAWKTLENILNNPNDPRTQYYNLIIDATRKLDKSVPYNKRLYTALPVVSKTTLERFQAGESAKSILKDKADKTFQKHAEDIEKGISTITDEKGNPIDFIPTRYLRTKAYDVNDQSFDLSTIYWLYHRSATNYVEKTEVQAEAELVKTIAQTRNYTVRDNKGNVINKLLGKDITRPLTKSGSQALIVDQYTDFLKLVLYGQTNLDEGDWNVFGYKVDKAKAAGLLGKYTAYNMLGLNVIQGLSNINMGELQQLIEGIAGEYFTTKELHNATTVYFKDLFNVVGDIGLRDKNSIVNHLNEKFDILNEYEGGEFRKNSRFANMMLSDALFFTSHAGEHFMQSRVMITMLKKLKALDKDGKELGSMYDMYKVDKGKLTLDPRVDLDKSNWTEEEQILYGEKIKRLLARIHGEYSSLGRNAVQKYALGRLGMMFRKFIVPGVKKRFEKKTPNEFLGEYTEGSYREFGHYLKQLGKSLYSMKLSMMTEHWNQLLPREKANIKRALSEVMAMIMFALLSTIFLSLHGEADDDDEKRLYGNIAYLFLRGKSELSFYYNPVEAMNILRSPAASMSVIENITKLIGGMMPPDFTMFETYERGPWEGHLKIEKNLMNFVPAYRQYYRVRDIDDVITNFTR